MKSGMHYEASYHNDFYECPNCHDRIEFNKVAVRAQKLSKNRNRGEPTKLVNIIKRKN